MSARLGDGIAHDAAAALEVRAHCQFLHASLTHTCARSQQVPHACHFRSASRCLSGGLCRGYLFTEGSNISGVVPARCVARTRARSVCHCFAGHSFIARRHRLIDTTPTILPLPRCDGWPVQFSQIFTWFCFAIFIFYCVPV